MSLLRRRAPLLLPLTVTSRLLRPQTVEATCVIAGFVVLTLFMTYPLVHHLTDSLPGDLGDPLLNAWILAWDSERLLHGLQGFWDAPFFYPYARTLTYSEHLLGIAILVAPIQWLSDNLVLTYNPGFPFCLPRMAPYTPEGPPSARNSCRRTFVQLQRPSPQPALTCDRLAPLLSGHFSDTAPHVCRFFARRASLHSARASACRRR